MKPSLFICESFELAGPNLRQTLGLGQAAMLRIHATEIRIAAEQYQVDSRHGL
ncbi:MAG: hypothetical protein AAGG44_03760 [Planctomycetota bacterium]